MPNHRKGAVQLLFRLSQAEVDRDLRDAEGRFRELMEERAALTRPLVSERTAAIEARDLHLCMLEAHAVRKLRHLPEDLAFFLAVHAAEAIAFEACGDALDGGRAGELSQQMHSIEARAGLARNDAFSIADAPPDWRALSDECDALLDKIDATVHTQVLRRYRFADIATLYETDRVTYEVRREVGRRWFHKSRSESDSDECFLNRHGPAALALLKDRLWFAGLSESD